MHPVLDKLLQKTGVKANEYLVCLCSAWDEHRAVVLITAAVLQVQYYPRESLGNCKSLDYPCRSFQKAPCWRKASVIATKGDSDCEMLLTYSTNTSTCVCVSLALSLYFSPSHTHIEHRGICFQILTRYFVQITANHSRALWLKRRCYVQLAL